MERTFRCSNTHPFLNRPAIFASATYGVYPEGGDFGTGEFSRFRPAGEVGPRQKASSLTFDLEEWPGLCA